MKFLSIFFDFSVFLEEHVEGKWIVFHEKRKFLINFLSQNSILVCEGSSRNETRQWQEQFQRTLCFSSVKARRS